MCAGITDTVTVYLNQATDEAGRSRSMFTGYQAGDPLKEALTYTVSSRRGVGALLEQVFFDLNVGDDPLMASEVRDEIRRYRARRNRSLSIGDVVEIHSTRRRYVVAPCGFTPL